jgi:membrane-bound acyltransferase YfiQ involved in biofilm formation
MIVATMVLLWVPSVRLPPVLARMVLEIARLTMFIYLVHAPLLWKFGGTFESLWAVFLATLVASVLGAVIARQAYLRTERVGLAVLRRLGVGRQPS